MTHARWRSLAILALPILAAAAFGALPPAPVAKTIPVTDDYFGAKIVDPYRWMEQPGNSDLSAYLAAQNLRARAVLNAIPGRAALFARIRALQETVDSIGEVQQRDGWIFYKRLSPGASVARLCVRRGLDGAERVLVDPPAVPGATSHTAISYYLPSNDGAHVAVGLSAGGSENAVLHFYETATGRALPETIDRTDFGATSWRGDGRGVYYLRRQAPPPGAPAIAKYRNMRTYLHVLGTDPARDAAVFGIGISPEVPVAPDDFGQAEVSPDSPYALGLVVHGVQNELTFYVAPKADFEAGRAHWKKVADTADAVTEVVAHGDELYLLTHKDALRFKIVAVEAAHPDPGSARVVLPAGDRVIQSVASARDGLYVVSLQDGLGRITRIDWAGRRSEIGLPIEGSVSDLAADPSEPGFFARLEGWTDSPRWFAYDPVAGKLSDTRLMASAPVDYSGVVAEEAKVRARDGTLVPLSIIRPKSARLDGSNPTLLYAYGSYGISSLPSFGATRLAWFEKGGIYAIAHVRGGGEYGEEWHQAGKGPNKIHTVTDLIDCARWLVARGYTSPGRLGARGGSAGGITIGGAIARAPELFAAMIDEVPVSDQLRIEFTANGPSNVPEFGSVRTKEGFLQLLATSAVHQIRAGGRYPAVLLTTGINDPRVDPWQAAKMAATLQADSRSGRPILLRVDYSGGHGLIGANKVQAANLIADEYAFLFWQMDEPGFQIK